MNTDHALSGLIKAADPDAALTECGETLAVVRKKVLLRILACHDAEHAGIRLTEADIATASANFRRSFGLESEGEFTAWLLKQKLSRTAFAKAMHDFTLVCALEKAYAPQIDALVHEQIAVSTARLRSIE
jgi:hypothetical protein